MYNIFKYKKYEKTKTENGWNIRCVLRKKTPEGEISRITNLNSDKKPINVIAYSDENFEQILWTSKIKYNEDKSSNVYYVYEQNIKSWQSSIMIYDNNDRPIFCKWFEDKEFKNLTNEEIREYDDNQSYKGKVKSIDYIGDGYFIDFYNKNGVKIKVVKYKDKDFKEIEYCANIKYLKNGNVIYYNLQYNSETLYNSDNEWKVLSEKHYKNDDFRKLNSTCFYTYFDDGSYERKTVFANVPKDESKCVIEKYDNADRLIERKDYKDKKCKKLYNLITYKYENKKIKKEVYIEIIRNKIMVYCTKEYLENGNILCSKSYETLQENRFMSLKWEENKDNKSLWTKFYSDKNYKNLIGSQVFEYLNDNILIIKSVIEKPKVNDEYLSKIEKYKKDELISKECFTDKEFKDLAEIITYETDENGEYIIKEQYKNPNEDSEYFSKITITENDRITPKKELFYIDDNFIELYAQNEYFYTQKTNKYCMKSVFTMPRNEIMSAITYYNNKNYKALAFYNNDFTNLYRKTWGKFNKKEEEIRLRIYEEPENNYLSTLEKYDKDKNLIYEKKYKFKGILPRLIFIFSN